MLIFSRSFAIVYILYFQYNIFFMVFILYVIVYTLLRSQFATTNIINIHIYLFYIKFSFIVYKDKHSYIAVA